MNHFHDVYGPFSAAEVAEKLKLSTQGGNANSPLVGILPIQEATPQHLSFLENPAYYKWAEQTKAGAVILHPKNAHLLPQGSVAILSPEPYADYARALSIFYQLKQVNFAETTPELHKKFPSAFVHATAKIGAGTTIAPGAYVGPFVVVGKNCTIGANVSLQCTEIGHETQIHPGACLGQDGFGFARTKASEGILKVPQVGQVLVGNHVEIGANTTIDRAALGSTKIGNGCKLDNLVQIGHNVVLGENCQLVAQVAVAGSTLLGNNVVVGGQTGIAGHLTIADGVQIAGRSGVTKSIEKTGDVWAGFPAMPIQQWRRQQAQMARLAKKK